MGGDGGQKSEGQRSKCFLDGLTGFSSKSRTRQGARQFSRDADGLEKHVVKKKTGRKKTSKGVVRQILTRVHMNREKGILDKDGEKENSIEVSEITKQKSKIFHVLRNGGQARDWEEETGKKNEG